MKIDFNSLVPPQRRASCGESAGRQRRDAATAARRAVQRRVSSTLTVSAALAAAFLALSVLNGTIPGVTRGSALAATERVTILADDCSTAKTTFYLGETVCAIVEGAPPPSPEGFRQRFFQWVTPNQWVSQQTDIIDTAQKELFTIPSSGPHARTGKWSLRTVDNDPGTQTHSYFVVRDPSSWYVDLAIVQQAPPVIEPGDTIQHRVLVSNAGPDYAKGIEFVVSVPTQMTFAAVKQASGMPFTCKTPARGETGNIVCQADYLLMDDGAEFFFYYYVDTYARDGSTSSNSGEIYNFSVSEAYKEDNYFEFTATVAVPGKDEPSSEP